MIAPLIVAAAVLAFSPAVLFLALSRSPNQPKADR